MSSALGHSDIELAMALKEKKAELELRHRNAIEARALRDKKASDVDACTTADSHSYKAHQYSMKTGI